MTKEWEKSFQEFLKYAGQELRRAGNELKQEAQELLENQEKLKKSLQVFSTWAKSTAKEVAEVAQKHAHEAESKWSQTVQKGFCGFGKKEASQQTTWGEPVEKIRTESPPHSKEASTPKAAGKSKKASVPKAAGKSSKAAAKPKKRTAAAAKKASDKPAAKTKRTTKSS